MTNKYKLTTNTKQHGDITLYQIQALKDFGDVKKGDLGGWIEIEDNLSQDGDARVSGNARIYLDAQVYGNARVYGNAQVYGNAVVSGNAEVSGDARISGNAMVSGNARISGTYNYTRGWFIGGDDTGTITDITDKMGSEFWENQYVLGDYEITPIEETRIEEETSQEDTLNGKEVEIDGKTYILSEK